MNVPELSEKLGARILTGEPAQETKVQGMYCCDLLSWVMSYAKKGSAWITVHTHLNIVAVATLMELSCIIIPDGIEVDETTIRKAVKEGVTILGTKLSAYEICCVAHDCGI